MKIPVVKTLVENYTLEQLQKAENAILEEQKPEIEIGGDDEGEQLTHIYGAKWILEQMQKGDDFKASLRAFTQRVRDSIS